MDTHCTHFELLAFKDELAALRILPVLSENFPTFLIPRPGYSRLAG